MFVDAKPGTFSAIYMCAGYTDLRKNIDGLAAMLIYEYNIDPYLENVLFLFCGRCAYKIKGLVWESNGFTMINKRLSMGRYQWNRDQSKGLIPITHEQFQKLMTTGKIE